MCLLLINVAQTVSQLRLENLHHNVGLKETIQSIYRAGGFRVCIVCLFVCSSFVLSESFIDVLAW
jgi:hypothetical protein